MKAFIDTTLWVALREQADSRLFDVLYQNTLQVTFALCSEALHDPDATEEAVQATYARLWEMILHREKHPIVDQLPPLVVLERLAILQIDRLRKRHVRDLARKVSLEMALEVHDPRPCVRECLARSEKDARVREAIENLPPGLSQPLVLYYYQRCTYEEIGQFLNLDRTTVSRRIAQSIAILKAQFASREE